MTNFQFEERAWRGSTDRAIHEITFCLAWPHYDDYTEHRLDGPWAITDGRKKDFARAALFLKTDHEYRWPTRSGLHPWGVYFRRLFGLKQKDEAIGDIRVWPFWSRDDYRAALQNPPYLIGRAKKG
jgi:hypothetical protein